MKEKIENTNFSEITLDGANKLLTELLTYDGEEFKDYVITVIDSIDNSIIEINIHTYIHMCVYLFFR